MLASDHHIVKYIFVRTVSAHASARRTATAFVLAACMMTPLLAHAELVTLPTALQRTILTSVLQGSQSVRLPSSAQSAVYRFDPALDTFVRNSRPGPTVLRSPETLRAGSWSARVAVSYFALDGNLGSTTYEAVKGDVPFFSRFGSEFQAKSTQIEFSTSYGVTDRLEISLGIPVSIVDLESHYRWVYDDQSGTTNPAGAPTRAELERRTERGPLREIVQPTEDVGYFGPQRFRDGTQAGLGQISIAGKYGLYRDSGIQLSPYYELLLPSPNEDQFAGPANVGMTARVVSSIEITDWATSFVDAGYTYQIEFPELTGFVWNAGASVSPVDRLSVDIGAGGTVFSRGITRNPPDTGARSGTPEFVALDETELGTNAVNFLFGVKLLVTEDLAASGGVVVPVTNDGIRPAAAGTIALEAYF